MPLYSQKHDSSAQTPITDSLHQIDSLKKIIKEQNNLIGDFKDIKDDILAQKVFESSKSRLVNWITFGGIILLLIAIIGYFKAISVIKEQVADKMQKISQKQIFEEIKEQSGKYVEELIAQKKQELDISAIARSIQEEGNNTLHTLLSENKGQFDSFVNAKKSEIELLVKQLKESAEAFANPIGAVTENSVTRQKKEAIEIPEHIDYTNDMSPVRDQLDEGNSVGFATAACVEYQIFKQSHKNIQISPRQIYYYARLKGPLGIKGDNGAFIKDAIKAIKENGAIEETIWPYKAGEYNKKPPAEESKAVHYKVTEVAPVKNLKEIKSELAVNGPIVIGITVYESFLSSKTAKDGLIHLPKQKETVIGGHAVCLVGYKDEENLFTFRNSCGKKWGDDGYGYLTYEYIDKFSNDGWAIKKIEIVNPV